MESTAKLLPFLLLPTWACPTGELPKAQSTLSSTKCMKVLITYRLRPRFAWQAGSAAKDKDLDKPAYVFDVRGGGGWYTLAHRVWGKASCHDVGAFPADPLLVSGTELFVKHIYIYVHIHIATYMCCSNTEDCCEIPPLVSGLRFFGEDHGGGKRRLVGSARWFVCCRFCWEARCLVQGAYLHEGLPNGLGGHGR